MEQSLVPTGREPTVELLGDRLRHALTYLDEARRAAEQALDLLARVEHEREAERPPVVLR